MAYAPPVHGSLRFLAVLVLATALATSAAAQQPAPPGVKVDWRGTGVVLAILRPPSDLHATRPVIVIRHEPIPGLMNEAMAMPFLVDSEALFRGLAAGDHIAFGLADAPGALLVVSIERLPR
jgi:Cu/Ag efflux protein CusF